MIIGEWIGLSSLLIANVGAVYLTYNNFNKKISRIYERFDIYKTHIEKILNDEFVHKDLCTLTHTNNNSILSGLEARMEKRFDKLDLQIAQLLNK